VAQRVVRGVALLFHDHGREGGEWSTARPSHTLPLGKTWYPFYSRLGGSQGRSGRCGKSRPDRDSIPDCPARSQFDKVDCNKLWNIVYERSSPPHLIETIKCLYESNIIQIDTSSKMSKEISANHGVRQGYSLLLTFFFFKYLYW